MFDKYRNYNEVDGVLQEHFDDTNTHRDHPVILRHYATAFKRNNPYNIPRDIVCCGVINN